MAIDFEAIRRKVAELSGEKRSTGSSQLWKLEEGTHTVRLIPFKENDGQPFKERYFHYGLGTRGFLSLKSLGKNDPVQDLASKLWEENSPESREIAKKLYPKMRAYVPVIIRDKEDLGVVLWGFSKTVYQSLLNIMLDPDFGDITDPLEGRDIKVKVTKKDGFQHPFPESVIPRGKQTKLHEDPEQIKTWIDSTPDLDEILKNSVKNYEEVEKILNDWISGGESDNSVGTERFGSSSSSNSDSQTETSEKNTAYKDLDDAFADLLS